MLAYATIAADGTVSNAQNISQANVVHAGGSGLCISGLSFTPGNVIASSAWAGGGQVLITSAALGSQGLCPGGTQVSIATYNTSGNPAGGTVQVLIN